MQSRVFADRLACLRRKRFPVLSLDEALTDLYSGNLSDCATVITIDDGWYGTSSVMWPLLRAYGFPATLYLSTYYMAKETQVFNVASGYVLWKSSLDRLDLSDVDESIEGVFDLRITSDRDRAWERLNAHARTLKNAKERQEFLGRTCSACGVDLTKLEQSRMFSFVNSTEARMLFEDGMDLQLHTHRHVLPASDFDSAKKEIVENRNALTEVSNGTFEHFCFPSGEYTNDHLKWLDHLSIQSATTTKVGLNTRRTPRYELRRFVDSDVITQLEFEAEICGFNDLIRRLVRFFTGRIGNSTDP